MIKLGLVSCMRLTEVQFAPYRLPFFNYLLIDRIKLLKQNKTNKLLLTLLDFYILGVSGIGS